MIFVVLALAHRSLLRSERLSSILLSRFRGDIPSTLFMFIIQLVQILVVCSRDRVKKPLSDRAPFVESEGEEK